MPYLVLIALALAAVWWATSRVRVTSIQPTMLATRIAFPGGVRLDDPAAALAGLENPDEIVIPFEHAVLVIDYPLTQPARVPVVAPIAGGFTRAELVRTICEQYATVYETEQATATHGDLSHALSDRTSGSRRPRTDGLYGIWGYDLDALVLTATRWSRRPDGTVMIELHVQA